MKKINNLTVIIVTYLTDKKILLNCLKSIDKKIKVIIVENSKKFTNKNYFLKRFPNLEILCTGLNLGYGKGDKYLELNLVFNPQGASLPPPQSMLEKKR